MNENEEERKEQKENKGLTNKLRDIFRRGNKSKFKMFMTMIMSLPVGIQIAMVIVIGAILLVFLGAFTKADQLGSNNISSVASSDIIKKNVDIVKTDDGRYYFKIDKEVVDEYIKKLNKAYLNKFYDNVGSRTDDEEDEKEDDDKEETEEEKEKEEYVYNEDTADIKKSKIEDWFGTKDYKAYLVKMIRAEIASSSPLLSDYDGEEERKDEQGNKQDKDDNYVAQGIVQIQRTKISESGEAQEPISLKYLPYESEDPNELTFKSLVDSESEDALNYYSFEEDKIHYATYRKIVGGADAGYKVSEGTPISYKSVANMCSMPFDFLFSLLQVSENPEWIMKVVDLLLENSEVVIMLQDQLTITTITDTTAQMQRTTTTEETKINVSPTGGDAEAWITTGAGGTSYGYVNQETTAITTYQNTVNSYIKKANTWCIDFEQEAVPDNSESSYEKNFDYSPSDVTFGGTSSSTNENGNTRTTSYTALSERVMTYTRTDTKNFRFKINISTEKRINYDKFLGLWKNEKGKYELGAAFDPNGKMVGYELPKDGIGYPADDISELNHQRIDSLLELLHLHDDTQFHEQLMMLYWNKYRDDEVYKDVNEDKLLNLFDTNLMTRVGNGAIAVNGCNLTREEFIECVQNYSSDAGYQQRFGQYAGVIYDICMSKNINPILCVAVAGSESGFGRAVPSNSPFNYWGFGVYNGQQTGTYFATIEDGVTRWCDLIVKYQTPGTWENNEILRRSAAYKVSNPKYTGSDRNVYDLWTIYAGLGGVHSAAVGNGNAKTFIINSLNLPCTHGLSEPTTDEEEGAYIVWYVDRLLMPVARDVFGSKAFGGAASEVADFALTFVGQGHSTFTSWWGYASDWCAMFVSYCFDQCGLIPSVLPEKYAGCSSGANAARKVRKT